MHTIIEFYSHTDVEERVDREWEKNNQTSQHAHNNSVYSHTDVVDIVDRGEKK